jgi:hypothetical protein
MKTWLMVTLPLKYMIVYERCMKISVVLNPLALNKQPQDRQRTLGYE